MTIKSFTKLSVILLACGGLLTACSSNDSEAINKKSYASASHAKNSKIYKLAFFDNAANSDTQNAYYSLGYYVGDKVVQKSLSSESDTFMEIIDPNIDKPYVVIKNNSYYIHRPPYTQYNQPLIKGKVSEKEK